MVSGEGAKKKERPWPGRAWGMVAMEKRKETAKESTSREEDLVGMGSGRRARPREKGSLEVRDSKRRRLRWELEGKGSRVALAKRLRSEALKPLRRTSTAEERVQRKLRRRRRRSVGAIEGAMRRSEAGSDELVGADLGKVNYFKTGGKYKSIWSNLYVKYVYFLLQVIAH